MIVLEMVKAKSLKQKQDPDVNRTDLTHQLIRW